MRNIRVLALFAVMGLVIATAALAADYGSTSMSTSTTDAAAPAPVKPAAQTPVKPAAHAPKPAKKNTTTYKPPKTHKTYSAKPKKAATTPMAPMTSTPTTAGK